MWAVEPVNPWRIWIDTGGTFTDCLAIDPAGQWHRAKVLSSSCLRSRAWSGAADACPRISFPQPNDDGFLAGWTLRVPSTGETAAIIGRRETWHLQLDRPLALEKEGLVEATTGEEAPVLAIRMVTGTRLGDPFPRIELRLGTTRGTNALLERKMAPTALFITRGLGDLLEVGTQQRPDIFARAIVKPAPLHCRTVEVDERLNADGTVLRALDEGALRLRARESAASGVRSAAVALMHSYLNPAHELRTGSILREEGFTHVSLSSSIAPLIRILPRAQTAVVNACLAPVIEDYLAGIRASLGGALLTFDVLTSAGGLVDSVHFLPKDSLLSGPAGGVAGAAAAGREAGIRPVRLLAFDMGGTSTDVARLDGDFSYVFEHRVGDAHLVAPALDIESVAAGGGSICRFADGRLTVGPDSAGAAPGPACYGAGGPLTITDINLLLGLGGRYGLPIDDRAARERFREVMRPLRELAKREGRPEPARQEVMQGFLDIANEKMADAIHTVSLRAGYDPADFTLVAFGGAGGQHACAVAELLGIRAILFPREAGLLSAFGIGGALRESVIERQVLRPLREWLPEAAAEWHSLDSEALAPLLAPSPQGAPVGVRRRIASLRFAGQDHTVPVDWKEGNGLEEAFRLKHAELFGHAPQGRAVEVESLRVIASGAQEAMPPAPVQDPGGPKKRLNPRVVGREDLGTCETLEGPVLVIDSHATLVIAAGWSARIDAAGNMLLTREEGPGRHGTMSVTVEGTSRAG